MTAMREHLRNFQIAVMAGMPPVDLFSHESAEGGFAIYANAYRARLAAALRDNYPVLHRALGDDSFDALGATYIEHEPSRFRSIRWFGDRLAEFLAAHEELVPHPSLVDLARMDWALRQSFDAADEEPLRVEDLSALAPGQWPQLRFRTRAATQLVWLRWSVEPAWQALNQDAAAETEPPLPLPHALLVWRQGLDCRWRSLDAAEAAGLTALFDGVPFETIYECMFAQDAALTFIDAAMKLRLWVELGLLAQW